MRQIDTRTIERMLKTPTMQLLKEEHLKNRGIIETPVGAVWVKSYATLDGEVIQVLGFTVRDTIPVIYNDDSGWEDPNVWLSRMENAEEEPDVWLDRIQNMNMNIKIVYRG